MHEKEIVMRIPPSLNPKSGWSLFRISRNRSAERVSELVLPREEAISHWRNLLLSPAPGRPDRYALWLVSCPAPSEI
jgi:hypothetical protein